MGSTGDKIPKNSIYPKGLFLIGVLMEKQKIDIVTNKSVDDLKKVSNFLSYLSLPTDIFPTLYSYEYFRWKIGSNPFGKSACYIRYKDGEPAAHCSITAKPLNPYLGIGAGCGELGDTHTHPNFRRQGHFGEIGSHTIRCFDQSEPVGEKLIYGLPNDQALPGWIRRAGCDEFSKMNVWELKRSPWKSPLASLKSLFSSIFDKSVPSTYILSKSTDRIRIKNEIDQLWSSAIEKESYLLQKDGNWWLWRYENNTETYQTFILRDENNHYSSAYIVAKIGWQRIKKFKIRYIQICEIFSSKPLYSEYALKLFMKTVSKPLDTVFIWTQNGTALAKLALKYGFVKQRDVPIVFAKNSAYDQLANNNALIRFSLGDSDIA